MDFPKKSWETSQKFYETNQQQDPDRWGILGDHEQLRRKFRFCSVENDVPKILQVLVDVVGMNLRESNSATVLQLQTDEKTWLTIGQHSALLFTRNQDWGWVKIEDLGDQRF